MQCDKMLLARYQSMSGRLLAADGWMDGWIDDDDDENGQDSTRVMNSLVWFDLIVIPQGRRGVLSRTSSNTPSKQV